MLRFVSKMLEIYFTKYIEMYVETSLLVRRSETRMRKHASPTIKSPHTPGRDTREIKQRRSEWRITKMVLAIFLSFVACYLPITIVKVSDAEVRYPGNTSLFTINTLTYQRLCIDIKPLEQRRAISKIVLPSRYEK